MKKSILALSLLISTSAFAAEDDYRFYITANIAAYHLDRDATEKLNLNETNPGIGFEVKKGNLGLAVGNYQNSIRNNSNYALVTYTPINVGIFGFGVVGGAVTGYNAAPVVPAAGLLVTVNTNTVGANIIITPDVPELGVYGFVGLQLTYKIN